MKNIFRIFTAILFAGLMFTAANAQLQAAEWKLVEAKSDGEEVVLDEGIKTTLSYGPGMAMFGNAGCNRYSTTYKIRGENIEFAPIISTKMACADERMKQETTFFAIIEKVKKREIKDDYLFFYDESKRNVLKFKFVLKEDPKDEIPPNKC